MAIVSSVIPPQTRWISRADLLANWKAARTSILTHRLKVSRDINMPNCKVFFSYARKDKSVYLDDFFEKLRDEVMQKIPIELPHDACFRDSDNVEIGDRWTPEMVNALNTTSVLVCIYSPSYFLSEYCGKEVRVFQSRIDEYKKTKHDIPNVILPVLWEKPSTFSIPTCLRDIQYTHKSIHNDYLVQGLKTLSKIKEYTDAYLIFIEQLAMKIQEITTTIDLPEAKIGDIASLTSAFSIDKAIHHSAATMLPSTPNPKQTRIVFATGIKNELDTVRNKTESYGEQSEYWKPFYPETDEEIGIISQQVVSEKKFHYLPIQFSENLPEIFREAEDNNCVAILIVDPWSMKLEKYKKPISKFNELQFDNSAVVVIWNLMDDETDNEKDYLFDTYLFPSLSRCFRHNIPGISESVTNINELKKALSAAIDDARAMIMKRAKPFQIIKTESISMPLLSVPGVSKNG
jgi:FxsC-like protein